mgnify:CR=1 FL=1
MRDTDLYSWFLGIQAPWLVTNGELGKVWVCVAYDGGISLECPERGQAVPGYDSRKRKWCHLDTCQLHTLLVADVPPGELPGARGPPGRCPLG